ncbi:MAG: hypothetical protein EBT61_06140 [Verrucomicrobia bacterium]|nr:hypothetical protein [Verrucomicrobiota bacterium]
MAYAAREARMSDTPPDRKEAGDAPEGPRNPWVTYLVWAILVPVLYVLSIGPVVGLIARDYLPEEVAYIYLPLEILPESLYEPIRPYLEWWLP